MEGDANGEAAQALSHLFYLAQRRPALGQRREITLRQVPIHRLRQVRQDYRLQTKGFDASAQPLDIARRAEVADQQVDPAIALSRARRRRNPLLNDALEHRAEAVFHGTIKIRRVNG